MDQGHGESWPLPAARAAPPPEPAAATTRRRDLLALAGGLLSARARRHGPPATPLPPLPLPAGHPLESLGGLRLDRAVLGFGGLSGLQIDDEARLTAVSDTGRWLRARLVLEAGGQPRGLAAVESGALSDGLVFGLPGRFAGDAESLARLPDGGFLVGFERWHRLRAYARIDGPGTPVAAPPGLAAAPPNASLESVAVLADGRWMVLTEGLEHAPGLLRGWLGGPGRWLPFSYRPSPGFLPTDLAPLPDGGALLVERRFDLRRGGFGGRLLRLPAARLAGLGRDAVLTGDVLLHETELPAENWEGVATFRRGGRQMVALLTDDNEVFLQRGLLLLFAMRPTGG